MPVGKPLKDVVVVVPGILGSRLARIDETGGRHEIWGTSAATLAKNLLTFGRRIKQLAISPDADPDTPGDGIAAIGLISDFQIIPGFLSIAGYDGLMTRLRRDNSLRHDQVVGFAYDWRLSNRVAGRKLASFLDEHVTRWRTASGDSDARAVLVCHSMGGLVARWCTEREHGHELVSRTITVGTPYKGAAMALDALVNGVQLPRRIGPHFDELVRSLPSVRELLPTYACVRTGAGPLKHLDETDILPAAWVAAALEFHQQLATAAEFADRSRTDTLDAFRGGLQPTLTTVSLSADRVLTAHESSDGTMDGRDDRGDGTVPRDSATPPEWSNPSWAKAVAQRHSSMHLAASVGNELAVMLSDAPRLMSGRQQIGLRVPGPVPAGQATVISIDGPPGLGLTAVVSSLDGSAAPARKGAKREDGRYRVRLGELPPGLYHVQIVRSSPSSTPVDEISDTILIYNEG
jgi:pimeloyl-ACP methyl ester carboxylesterase